MILIALGANLASQYGSPEDSLEAAKVAMRERGIEVIAEASVWLSAPVPVSDQPWYRNSVVAVRSALKPHVLLGVLKSIERDFGRVEAVRNAPRVIDLDILSYHAETVEEEACIIPHPRLHERAFVLYPLREIAPEWVHPVMGQSVEQMIAALPEGQEIKKLSEGAA